MDTKRDAREEWVWFIILGLIILGVYISNKNDVRNKPTEHDVSIISEYGYNKHDYILVQCDGDTLKMMHSPDCHCLEDKNNNNNMANDLVLTECTKEDLDKLYEKDVVLNKAVELFHNMSADERNKFLCDLMGVSHTKQVGLIMH